LSTYFLIIFSIIIVPLIYSIFDKTLFYLKNIKSLIFSILIVGGFFIVWDIIVTIRGHWDFSKNEIFGIYFFGLPIEEILFFIVVPFSCLLIWETLNFFNKSNLDFSSNKFIFYLIGSLFILFSLFFIHLEYTFVVLFITGLTLLLTNFSSNLFFKRNYYFFIIICFLLFLFFNYLLTSIPIVIYGSNFITNFRILTIPIEDFFYNFSLLTLYLLVYELFKKIK
jgi:lycopene cyclase domain-containing protein